MRGPTKRAVIALVIASGAMAAVAGQTPNSKLLTEMLMWVLPDATTFSTKEGNPPHFTGYIDNGRGQRTPVGYAWWTTEIEPTEFGYEGPIKMIVGMNLHGVITGVDVVQHSEPFGSFSIDTPEFAEQFRGKSIRDPFRVGHDVDAVSRASISVTSASRTIRNSARKIARALLSPEDVR